MAASPLVVSMPRGASDAPLMEPAPEASLGGFDIQLPSAQLADLIQINCVNRVRGAFRVRSGQNEGHLFFEHGQLVHADFGDASGLDAVVLMLGWHGGSIAPCVRAWPERSTIDMGADALLLRAAQRLDESASRGDVLPPDATTKVVRRVDLSPELCEAAGVELGEAGSVGSAPTRPALSHLQVAQVTTEGVIQQLKAGACRELADTSFFCQRMATMIGDTLGLGPARALSFEGQRESIVVIKGRSIVGTRGATGDLDFILEKVGLK